MAIHQKLGNTVLMITHDVDEAVLLSDRIVMMTNGPAAHIGEVLDVPLRAAAPPARAGGQPDLPENAASACSNSSTSATASSKQREARMSGDFTPEQKRYLEGFVSGLADRAHAARGRAGAASARREPAGPDADAYARRRTACWRPAESSPTRKSSSASSIRSTPMGG